eukprot:SAG25_NODE_10943_length_318_cov_1.086758_1_plen_38_part_10
MQQWVAAMHAPRPASRTAAEECAHNNDTDNFGESRTDL